jgi:hypothetical protein
MNHWHCLSFKEYLSLKASKFRIKTYELCDITTGYLCTFLAYDGKNSTFTPILITADTLKLQPLF